MNCRNRALDLQVLHENVEALRSRNFGLLSTLLQATCESPVRVRSALYTAEAARPGAIFLFLDVEDTLWSELAALAASLGRPHAKLGREPDLSRCCWLGLWCSCSNFGKMTTGWYCKMHAACGLPCLPSNACTLAPLASQQLRCIMVSAGTVVVLPPARQASSLLPTCPFTHEMILDATADTGSFGSFST